MKLRKHTDLEVWKKSVHFVTKIYEVTKSLSRDELYGLTNQIRRAAVSIPSNIAEGTARYGNKEIIRFLYYALGSAAEVETQLIISKNLKYIDENNFSNLLSDLNEIRKMLIGLMKYFEKTTSQ